MIRKANVNDAKDIVKVNVMGWKNTYKNIFPQTFLDELDPEDENSIRKCQEKINQYAVCEVDNKIVAMIRYGRNKKSYDDSYAEIYALYVDDSYKKQGIGSKLVEFAFEELKNEYDYLLISTLVDNSANEFYKKIGGKFVGNCDFLLGNDKFVENVYEYLLK